MGCRLGCVLFATAQPPVQRTHSRHARSTRSRRGQRARDPLICLTRSRHTPAEPRPAPRVLRLQLWRERVHGQAARHRIRRFRACEAPQGQAGGAVARKADVRDARGPREGPDWVVEWGVCPESCMSNLSTVRNALGPNAHVISGRASRLRARKKKDRHRADFRFDFVVALPQTGPVYVSCRVAGARRGHTLLQRMC